MVLFLIILAKLARSALKTAQREGKEFIFQLEVEGIFFKSSDVRTAYVGRYWQFFPILFGLL